MKRYKTKSKNFNLIYLLKIRKFYIDFYFNNNKLLGKKIKINKEQRKENINNIAIDLDLPF